MAEARIKAVITAEDRASAVVGGFSSRLQSSLGAIAGATIAAGLALDRLTGFMGGTLDAANKSQSALIGLNTVAKAFKSNTDDATKAAQALAEDGLMTVGDAATGLKNLLASGFSLNQAITLMKRFKDSAAFGRQSALSFGDAVTSATQGIKNGNSILVDNAGVTKNLSMILEEAGFSAQDLMRATTDASVRQALFNGILKETNPQLGDAERLTQTFAGKQAMAAAQTTILKQQIGEALMPALLKLLEAVTPLIIKFAEFTEKHPGLVAGVLLFTTVLLGLVTVVGSVASSLLAIIMVAGPVAGAITTMTGAAAGLAAALAVPFVLVVAGVAAVIYATQKIRELEDAWRGAENAEKKANDSYDRMVKNAREQYAAGKITKERLNALTQGRASGGPVAMNHPYIVGEKGPELFVPSGSGTIIPNHKLGTAASNNTTINLSVNVGTFVGTEMEKRRLAEDLFRAYEDLKGARGLAA